MAQQQGWWSADPLESDYKPARPAASDSWWENDPISEPDRPKAAAPAQPPIPEPAPFVPQDERTTVGAMGRQVARGAIETAGLVPKGAAALGYQTEANARDFAAKQLQVMDRVDRGEQVAETEDAMGYQHMPPALRAQRRADLQAQVQANATTNAPVPIEQRQTFKAGEAIDEYGRTRFPTTKAEDEAFWTGQVPRALGSTVAMAPMAVAGAPLGALGRLLAGVGISMTGSGEATQNAVDRRRSLEDMVRSGDAPSPESYPSDRQIATAAGQGLAPGALDAAAIDNLLRPVVRVPGFRGLIAAVAKKAIEQGIVEGTTEGVQQVMQNMIAQHGYNPDQGVLDQVAENVLVGGAVGVLTGGLAGGMIRPHRGDPLQTGGQTPQTIPQQEIPPGVSHETSAPPSQGGPRVEPTFDWSRLPPVNLPAHVMGTPTEPAQGAPPQAGEINPSAPAVDPAAADLRNREIRPTPSSEDLQAVLDDPRPVAEIMAERERQAQRQATIAAVEQEDGPDAAAAVAKVMDGAGQRRTPMQAETAADVDMAAAQAKQPTPAQAEAGNYRKGHVSIQGLDIAIEVPRGGERTGVGPDGRPWSVTMPAHYGYLKAGKDSGDGKVDVFVGDLPDAPYVYVIDQIDPATGKFDEPKVMMGMGSQTEAGAFYDASYSDGSGPARMGAITRLTVAELKAWLRDGNPKKPLTYVPGPPVAAPAADAWASDPIVQAAPAAVPNTPPPFSESRPASTVPLGGQTAAPPSAGFPSPGPMPMAVAPQDPLAQAQAYAESIKTTLSDAEMVDVRELVAEGVDPEEAVEIALTRSGLDMADEIVAATEEAPNEVPTEAEAKPARAPGAVPAQEGPREEPADARAEAGSAPQGEQPRGAEPGQEEGRGTAVAVRATDSPAAPLTLRIGGRTYPVESVEEASRIFVAARDKFGEGASNTPTPLLMRGNEAVGYISYNGRVWAGSPQDRIADKAPIYDPSGGPVDPQDAEPKLAEASPAALPTPKADATKPMTARERREEKLRQKRDTEIKRREAAKKAIQTRKANASALNIVQTIAAAGGIKDTSGDLRTIMGRPNLMVPVYGALRNDKGMEPDRAREMLVEAGFLPEGATLNDLYAAIDQTVRGKPVMSARDVNEQLDRTEERKAQKYGDGPLYQRPRTEKIAVAKDSLSDEQMVIPGAERVAAEGRKAAKAPQRSVAETPLFGGAQDATRDVKRADADREAKKQGRLFQAGDSVRLRVAGEIDATVNLTPKDAAQRDAVASALKVTLRRMVGAAAPDTAVFDSMMVGEQEITGAYSPLNNLLAVSLRSPDPIGTVRHETIHVLRQLGLIDEAAWSALTQAAETGGWLDKHAIDERWGDGLTREQALEEAIAEEFGVGLREGVWKTGNAKVDAIFQRIAEFFRRVRAEVKRALAGTGLRDLTDADVAELVFSLIERGAFREGRGATAGQRHAVVQASPEDRIAFQIPENGARAAASRPIAQRMRDLRSAIAALRGGAQDPLAKVRVPNDIGWARKTMVTPRTIAAYFPHFADVFFAGTRQFRARDMSISELTEIARPYLDLDQAGKDKVGKVIEHGRMAGKVYSPRESDGKIVVENKVGQQVRGKIGGVTLMADGETVTLDAKEVEAYRAYRKVMDVALDKFRDQIVREWGFDPTAADAPKTASAVEALIEAEENAGERARLKTLAQVLSSIVQAKKHGYVPFTRYGSHYVTVTTLQDGKRAVVHREHIEPGLTTSPRTKLTRARLEQEAARLRARLAEIYPPDRGFEISELREVTPDSLGDIPNFSDLDAIIQAANLPPEQAAAVQKAIGEVIQKRGFRAHFIQSRNIPGYSVDFERSLADYIVGISSYLARREHLPEIEDAIASIPATQPELRRYAKDWNDYIQNPSEEFQGPRQAGFLWYLSGRFSSAVVNLSQIPMVTQPYLSMFAGHTAAAAEIARAYKDAALAIRPKTKAAGGAGLDVFSPDALPEDVRDVVKTALADGTLMPIETFQEMARAKGRTPQSRSLAAKAQAAQDAAAFMFQAAERTNRLVSFIAAYRLAQRPEVMGRIRADLRDNPLWTRRRKDRRLGATEFASFVVEETQFLLGKLNRTRMMRGPGAVIFQFKAFAANYIELMARMGAFGSGVHRGGHRYAALASMMFAMFLVGGLMGLPGAEDGLEMIEGLIKSATGVDPQIERGLRESAGSMAAWAMRQLGASEETQAGASAFAGRAAARGVARETGVDVSQRIGMGRVTPRPAGTEQDDFMYRAIGLAGIPGSWVLRGIDIGSAISRGDWLQAGIRAAPEAIADPMRAYQLGTEGVKTIAKGRQVINPDDVLPDGSVAGGAANVTKRVFGFQPTGISRAREQMNAVRRAGEAPRDLFADFNLRRANIQAAINRASDTLDRATTAEQKKTAEAAVKRESKRLERVMDEIETYNNSAPDERRYKLANPGYAQQLKVANQGQMATQIKKVPMRVRGSVEDIRARY